jgi:PAS domain S-box-containing protein
MKSEPQILIVDRDAELREALAHALRDAGLPTLVAADAEEGLAALHTPCPGLVLCGLPVEASIALRDRAYAAGATADDFTFVVLVDHGDDVERAFDGGADDVLRKPLRPRELRKAELLGRVRSHLRLRDHLEELARKEHDAQVMVELTQALASSLEFREILFTVVRRIADVVRVDRVSIVLAPEDANVGYVVAASDDEQLANLRLDLTKYPEIQQVLRTREPLGIGDVATHPVLDGVRDDVARTGLASLTLLPIVWEEQAMGVLFLRAASARGALTPRELGFCQVVANATAVALRNARVMQSLRDETQQVTFARFEAERRSRALKRYADYFASAADGLAAFDTEGRLLFGNPRAFALIGYAEHELVAHKLREVVHPDDVLRVRTLGAGFARGEFPRDVDLRVRRKDGSERTLNFSFSPLIDGEGAVLFSFRDVTEERATAAELTQTKEFLESLIDASVDPIVAADLGGTIRLFNKGAERVYGYPASAVIGKMSVARLYPEGGAREVMRLLRSPQHGGIGRLTSFRCDAVDATGALIPISLSAAIVYDGDEAVATFGIFTDLRDKLRAEERLAQAQEKLAITEKQALIAELAGTAAHELNQPLQSVMVYAEMLVRKLAPNSSEQQYARTVVSEAERMKDIVRKIGKITKYETKSYVGTQRILDLDKAVGETRESEPGRLASSWPPAAAARPSQAPQSMPPPADVVVPRPAALPIEETPRRSQLPPGGFPRPSQSPPSGLRRPSPLGIEGGSGFPLEGAPRPSQLPPGGFPRPSSFPASRDSVPAKPSAVFKKPGTPDRGEGGSGTGTGGQP